MIDSHKQKTSEGFLNKTMFPDTVLSTEVFQQIPLN